jgi:hypothetical protein
MLEPRWLRRVGLTGEIPATISIPGEVLDRDIRIVPPLTCPGADRYVAAYEQRIGVITLWEAYIDGTTASRWTVSELHHDPS